MATPPVRTRNGDLPRDIELICPEEIAQAARLLLDAQFGMGVDDLVTQTARVLGFNSTGSRIAARIREVLDAEMDSGRFVSESGTVRAAKATKPDD
jgi:hypothetical protein